MDKKADFKDLLTQKIQDIFAANDRASFVHGTSNIHESGMEVENCIRDTISYFLPEKYLVKQGHIIDALGNVSGQLDVIIFDRMNTPKFFETSGNTVYYPIESVLAVGEIKKTLRRNDAIDFQKKIIKIKKEMNRKLIPNPVYEGKIGDNVSLYDMVFMRTDSKYKNPLFTFIIAITSESEDFADDIPFNKAGCFPDEIHVLKKGGCFYGNMNEGKFVTSVEDEISENGKFLIVTAEPELIFARLLNGLLGNLSRSFIEPFTIANYIQNPEVFGYKTKDARILDLNKLEEAQIPITE